jgi:hypothetical protein
MPCGDRRQAQEGALEPFQARPGTSPAPPSTIWSRCRASTRRWRAPSTTISTRADDRMRIRYTSPGSSSARLRRGGSWSCRPDRDRGRPHGTSWTNATRASARPPPGSGVVRCAVDQTHAGPTAGSRVPARFAFFPP